jgi:integrase
LQTYSHKKASLIMGSVYRKAFTRPIPDGAEIVVHKGQKCARWKVKGKTRTAPLTTNGSRIALEASTFTAKFRDVSGKVREVPTGCKDETAARKVLNDLERRSELVKTGVLTRAEGSAADHLHTAIAGHTKDYLAHLQAGGVSAAHRTNVERQLNKIFSECGFKCLADIDRPKFVEWLNARTEAGMGARTRNTYHAAVIAFGNWATDPDSQRMLVNPFARVPKADEQAGKKRKRRAMTEKELVTLLNATRKRPLVEATTICRGKRKGQPLAKLSPERTVKLERLGRERALIYKTLVLTGLRRGELASLTVGQLELDDAAPHAQLSAADEKNREGNKIPLRADLVADLRAWIRENRLAMDAKLFTVPEKLIKIFNRDLKAAGIAKKDERGRTLDVHALRHSFSTLLSKGGVAPRTAQAAMRHSKIELTMNTYTDPALLDVQAALDVLPALPLTGDPQPILVQDGEILLAPPLALTTAQASESGTIPDKMDKICSDAIETANAPADAAKDHTVKPLAREEENGRYWTRTSDPQLVEIANLTANACPVTTYKTHTTHQTVPNAPQRCNERCKGNRTPGTFAGSLLLRLIRKDTRKVPERQLAITKACDASLATAWPNDQRSVCGTKFSRRIEVMFGMRRSAFTSACAGLYMFSHILIGICRRAPFALPAIRCPPNKLHSRLTDLNLKVSLYVAYTAPQW